MKKKRAAGLSMDIIIIAAIGFMVLIIVAAIFKGQSSRYSKGYSDVAEEAIKTAEGNTCAALFAGETRKCFADGPPKEGNWDSTPVPGEWEDCKPDKKCYRQIGLVKPENS